MDEEYDEDKIGELYEDEIQAENQIDVLLDENYDSNTESKILLQTKIVR